MNECDERLLTLVKTLNGKGYEIITKAIYLLIMAEKENPEANNETLKEIVLEQLVKYRNLDTNDMIALIENSENSVKTS